MGTHTREIQIAGYNRWYRGYISVDGVSTVNDTTSRITITAALDDKYAAQYGTHYDVIVNGTTYRSRDVLLNNYGNWATRDAVTFTVDVGRGASGWNCSVQIHVYGKTYNNYYGSAGGDAWATEYAWIPQRGYSQPHPPKNPKLARVSDTSHKITWDVDYTGMDGAYPWAGVYVDRRADDGSSRHSSIEACPGLLRADGRCELGAAEAAPSEIGEDVGRPDDHEHPEYEAEAADLIAQPDQRDGRQASVEEPGSRPAHGANAEESGCRAEQQRRCYEGDEGFADEAELRRDAD